MAVYRAVEVKIPEAQALLDLTSIKRDFERCRDMCANVECGASATDYDSTVIDAIATAIPIIYARPFTSGVRMRIDEATSVYNEDELVFHEQVIHMRSKYSAHSVNAMERQYVRVWLNPEERGRKINNVNAASDYLMALSGREYGRLNAMCKKLIGWVDERLDLESETLKKLIGSQYSLDDLYAMESGSLDPMKLDDVAKRRTMS